MLYGFPAGRSRLAGWSAIALWLTVALTSSASPVAGQSTSGSHPLPEVFSPTNIPAAPFSHRVRSYPESHVLVKVKVESPAEWRALSSLGAELYHREDGTALVRIRPGQLPSLDSFGFVWRELFGASSGPLYLFMSETGLPALPPLGAVVLDERDGTAIVTAGADVLSAARSLGIKTIPLGRKLSFEPYGFLDLEFIHDVVTPDIRFAAVIQHVSEDTLRSAIQHLENYGTRHCESFQITRAADWMQRRLVLMGYEGTYLQDVKNAHGLDLPSQNVIATKPGRTHPQFRIIVGGHYDSIVHGFPEQIAPGADDNASGTAGTLEIARLLAGIDLDATVQFVLFTAEEIGLFGSEEFAAQLSENDVPKDEVFCINMDMIAHVENDPWKVRIYNDKISTPMAGLALRVGEAYTELIPALSGWTPYSDHASFSRHGYPAIFVQEGDDNLRLHTPDDLLIHLDMGYAAEVVRMVLATVLHMGRLAEPPDAITASETASGEILVEWNHSTDADVIGYQLELLDSDQNLLAKQFTTENQATLDPQDIGEIGWVRVRAEDVLGEGPVSETILVGAGELIVLGATPNPTRGRCRFDLFIPGYGGDVDASFKIVDASGRLVRSIRDGNLARGPHVLEWNSVFDDGSRVPDGVYFYLLDIAGVGRQTGKIMVVQ